ncbi:MAG: hypothetical protein BGO43_08100 [Gammaproteobacteria bacterium 39-13]|nr:hypothetical protein [Gammaproteobacteria bacterium]OJV93128.1 MAG: hypothetical protein BGO43_08100 [Gammaproteobacteria bacterium 39-13]
MPKSLLDETMLSSHHHHYPIYLEKFSELYAKIKSAQASSENTALSNAAYHFAIFSHALANKSFLLAFDLLKEVNLSLHEVTSNSDTDSSLHEPANKLYKFTCNLQKQYEEFLEKKKLKND